MVECCCLQQEQSRAHQSSEGASNDGSDEEDEEEGDDSGQSQVLQGSDASDGEVVDVVPEDEVWMSEKRHSGDGEVTATFSSTWLDLICMGAWKMADLKMTDQIVRKMGEMKVAELKMADQKWRIVCDLKLADLKMADQI